MSEYIFVGGKGGVGKTTCAAALGVSRARSGSRVLLASTDPAHSLGDALGERLSATPKTVAIGAAGKGRLTALELDAPRAFRRWIQQHRGPLGDILEHGTWLDRHDVDELLTLSIPGVDELVGVVEIVNLARRTRPTPQTRRRTALPAFDVVIVDTAPTGHTLRLLTSPATVAAVADALELLQQKHRTLRARFSGITRPESTDRLIELLTEQARDTAGLLRDANQTSLCWVTLPEPLSIEETSDALMAMEQAGMRVSTIIVNQVMPEGPRCPICDRRRKEERRSLLRVSETLNGSRHIRIVPAMLDEPRGVARLSTVGAHLSRTDARGSQRARRLSRSPLTSRGKLIRKHRPLTAPSRLAIRTLLPARLLFFTGKGGTGKTTTAAAVALAAARSGKRNVLLLSVDPAHSAADVLGIKGSDTPSPHPMLENLFVRELDAEAAMAARRADIERALGEIASAVGSDGLVVESPGLSALLELAPPGIDELFGLLSVIDLLDLEKSSAQQRYDLVVVDAAPTGHALRLLEMPDAAHEWIQLLLRLMIKYRELIRPGRLAAEFVELSKSIRVMKQMLRDSRQTQFIVVSRAAELPRRETERLLKRLRTFDVAVPVMLVNAMTLNPGRCPRCIVVAEREYDELKLLTTACRRMSGDCAIIQTPLAPLPPQGIPALESWSRQWLSS